MKAALDYACKSDDLDNYQVQVDGSATIKFEKTFFRGIIGEEFNTLLEEKNVKTVYQGHLGVNSKVNYPKQYREELEGVNVAKNLELFLESPDKRIRKKANDLVLWMSDMSAHLPIRKEADRLTGCPNAYTLSENGHVWMSGITPLKSREIKDKYGRVMADLKTAGIRAALCICQDDELFSFVQENDIYAVIGDEIGYSRDDMKVMLNSMLIGNTKVVEVDDRTLEVFKVWKWMNNHFPVFLKKLVMWGCAVREMSLN